MTTLEQIRGIAAELPDVNEGMHFRLPTFKIGDIGFITVQKDAAIAALPEELSRGLSNAEPFKFELVTRNRGYFVGLKINLREVTIAEIKPLILEAWQFKKIPKKSKSKT